MIYNNPVDYKIEVTLDMFEEARKVPQYPGGKGINARCIQCDPDDQPLRHSVQNINRCRSTRYGKPRNGC